MRGWSGPTGRSKELAQSLLPSYHSRVVANANQHCAHCHAGAARQTSRDLAEDKAMFEDITCASLTRELNFVADRWYVAVLHIQAKSEI